MTESDFSFVGSSRPRVDAGAQVSGRTVFADDISLPGMLVGRQLRSPHGHARITRIDTARALALEGVVTVITGADLPITYGILPVSQDEHALALERVRYVGEPVAAVAAVDAETAARALKLIEVEYEIIEETVSIAEAATDRVLIHGDGVGKNMHRTAALEFGDVSQGFEEADHIREDLYDFRGSTHAALEQHAAVASHGADGRLTIWSSTQVPHYLHRTLEKVLELPAGRIRVVATPVGGGFGARPTPFRTRSLLPGSRW